MEKVQTAIRMPLELKNKLREYADKKGCSMKDFVLLIAWDYVKSINKKQ